MPDDLAKQSWDAHQRIMDRMKTCRSDPERSQPVAYTRGTADAVRQAIGDILAEMTAVAIVESKKREALEQRIAQLEAGTKPKGRAKAAAKALA